MAASVSPREIAAVLEKITSAVIVSHVSPDPDAIASSALVDLLLRRAGKKTVVINESGVEPWMSFIPGSADVSTKAPQPQPGTALIVLDCGDWKRVGDVFGPQLSKFSPIINIDHHASNPGFGEINLVLPRASSTCEVLFEIFSESSFNIDKDAAELLYIGLCFDTGSFRHNSGPRTFEVASLLSRRGVDTNRISQLLWGQISLAATRLQAEALLQVQVHAGGKIAEVVITEELCRRHGARAEDAKPLIDKIGSIHGVVVSVFARQDGDLWRYSLRSAAARYNVAAVAEKFGGGGHVQAAAFRSKQSFSEINAALLRELDGIVQ